MTPVFQICKSFFFICEGGTKRRALTTQNFDLRFLISYYKKPDFSFLKLLEPKGYLLIVFSSVLVKNTKPRPSMIALTFECVFFL